MACQGGQSDRVNGKMELLGGNTLEVGGGILRKDFQRGGDWARFVI